MQVEGEREGERSKVGKTTLASVVLVHTPTPTPHTHNSSNLVDLAHDTSIQFGSEPPLFSKPPGWDDGGGGGGAAATPTPTPQPADNFTNPIHSPSGGGGGGGGGIWGGALAAMAAAMSGGGNTNAQRPPSAAAAPPPLPPQPTAKPELQASFRKAAIEGLTARLQASLAASDAGVAAAAAGDADGAAGLASRAATLDAGLAALRAEKAALEAAVGGLRARAKEADAWLKAHEPKAPQPGGPAIDPDAAVTPADPLSAAALAAQAEDMAVEDALYALDRALAAGGLPPDAYLRAVRGLCARQFTLRATGAAVAARQHADGEGGGGGGGGGGGSSGGAGGGPDGAVAMPQGDSWSSCGVLAASNPLAAGGSFNARR